MFAVIVFLFIQHASSSEDCLNINVSITQNIESNGFHNNLNWGLEFHSPIPDQLVDLNSKFTLHVHVPSGMFVNPDEVADLMRLRKLSVYIDRNVNIETIESESESHTVIIFVPEEYDRKLTIKLPVHLRYQLAQTAGGFGKVLVPKPSLLMFNDKRKKDCNEYVSVEAPCDYKNTKQCLWKNISYQSLFDEIELSVPLGNTNHFSVVAVVTLLLGCIGCMHVLSVLSTKRN